MVALQTMLVTASELSPSSQKATHYHHWQPRFFQVILWSSSQIAFVQSPISCYRSCTNSASKLYWVMGTTLQQRVCNIISTLISNYMHTHKLTCRHGWGCCGRRCWRVKRGRENTYIHLLVQRSRQQDKKLNTWTLMVNWCGWVSNLKALAWHYRRCLWLLASFLHSHKSHHYHHWQPLFFNCICEVAHK